MGRMIGLSGGSWDSRDLDVVKKRLDGWRRNKGKGGGRIPEELWEAAAGLCRVKAPGRVAKELGLSYSRLKRRVKEREDFIEIDLPVSGWILECTRRDGARLCARGDGFFPEGIIRQFLS